MSCGHQASQDERGGSRQDFPGTLNRPRILPSLNFIQRLCREIISWKHLSHSNILPLKGVCVSVNPPCFFILSEWMPNGNVMEYTKSNPGANRLRLVSRLQFFPISPFIYPPIIPSSLRSHLVWLIFTNSASSMEILKV